MYSVAVFGRTRNNCSLFNLCTPTKSVMVFPRSSSLLYVCSSEGIYIVSHPSALLASFVLPDGGVLSCNKGVGHRLKEVLRMWAHDFFELICYCLFFEFF